MDALKHIRRPIEMEMERYRQLFDSRLQHANPILAQVLPVVAQRKGKMMRPILTLLAAKLAAQGMAESSGKEAAHCCADVATASDTGIYAAAAFEFFHTASLLHDDVVDESNERRGQASINFSYGNKVAVLVGDYLLAQSLYCASKTGSPRLVEVISDAASSLADGELLQLNNIGCEELSEDTYFSIIKNKTAALFAACAEAGAMSISSDEMDVFSAVSVQETLRSFGETVGICFQIRDDIFDYTVNASIGKPTGNDMKEGKLTLPAIYVLRTTQNAEMMAIASKVKRCEASEDEIAKIIDFIVQNGGIDYAVSAMNSYAEKAKGMLSVFSDSDVKQALSAYVDFVVDRNV